MESGVPRSGNGVDSATVAGRAARRHRIDPEAGAPLEEMLAHLPGGIGAIADLEERRRVEAALIAELAAETVGVQSCTTEDVEVPGPPGCPEVPVRLYRPPGLEPGGPAVFFIHGGGMVLGDLDAEHGSAVKIAEELGVLVVSTGYRKAPEHPHPAPVDDCFAALQWVGANQESLGYDPARLVVYGASAGGNLSIATAMKARDLDGPALCLMVAPYPMVDHRNVLPSTYEVTDVGVWDRHTNLEAWAWFLGDTEPDAYAAPLHASDLSGLPPALIDVGTVDLFRDEDIALVGRLVAAGVPTEFHLYPGAYHATEIYAPEAPLSRLIWSDRLGAMRRALGLVDSPHHFSDRS